MITAPTSTTTGGPSLAERLRHLDPIRRRLPVCDLPDEQALADELGARIAAPGVLLLERSRPLSRRHGRFRPGESATVMSALFAQASTDPSKWAFIDTETSGLAGGTGTWAFTCGVACIRGDELLLQQWLLTRLDAEPTMLKLLAEVLSGAELLISYNGKSFDLPLLITRFRLAGRCCALEGMAHLDLLYPVRRAFSSRWPDCRLATVERLLLGFQRDDDLPGAEAPAAWLDWLGRGDGGRLGAVLRHNRLDLISLAALVPAMARAERVPEAHGTDVGALARHRLRCGDTQGALGLLARVDTSLRPAERLLLASLYRRCGDWECARNLWEGLAAGGEPAALEALAKYHEHRSGDLNQALALVQRLPAGQARDHRRRRICRKLDAAGPASSLQLP
ncbi:MAG: ribonuclease H-like domain-containing protein [Thiohalocapsa sp.]